MGPMVGDNDSLLTEKLRREDPEQYHTLIRMHLSFLLDLNTDECDSASEKAKNRVLKWNLLPFTKKSKTQSKGVMEGAPLTQEGICQVYQLIEYLSKEQSIQQEGIFRRSGKLRRQQELKALLNQGITLDLNAGHYSVHDCASVLKNFLAELPEPLLTDAHYPAHFQIAEMCALNAEGKPDGRLLTALQLLLLLLPVENRVLLSDLLCLLQLTASYQHVNRMSAESLATLFTPHLACPRKMPPETLHANSQIMSRVVAFMIRQGASSLFTIPPQLATDIRAYWARKEANESESAKKSGIIPVQVDVGCCFKGEKKPGGESAEVNTVFSFVDRERTAQAHNSNPTEAALAQLYAHIRSLPESSEKRRLVKQFNKENGLGTPHQHHARILNQRGRSLGDSIKKHLFNKGIKCTKNGVNQGHFNVLQQSSADKSNSPASAPTPKLTMFQKSGDELSPLSKAPSHFFSSQSSSSSGEKEFPHLSQRKLAFSDSPSPENSCSPVHFVCSYPENLPKEIKSNASSEKCPLYEELPMVLRTSQDDKKEELDAFSSPASDCTNGTKPSKWNSLCKSDQNCSNCKDSSKLRSQFILPIEEHGFQSPMTQIVGTESRTWLQGSNSSPSTHVPILNKQLKSICPEVRTLVTSTPASHHPRHPSKLKTQSSIETSLLCHQTSCLLTPVTSEENSSMSPITKSTQKMSKAMQETMMTPRSRKPVLVLSGSNISQFPSLVHCSQIQREKSNESNSVCKQEDSIPKITPPLKKESTGSFSQLIEKEVNVLTGTPSNSENEELMPDEDSDTGSLTSTFVNYLRSRSVLTASPVDLSFKEGNGFDAVDFLSLKSERLSESLLYCLDGNVPTLSDSSLGSEGEKLNCSPSNSKRHLRPRKRGSTEAECTETNEDEHNSSVKRLASEGAHDCHKISSSPDRPKNKQIFETSL